MIGIKSFPIKNVKVRNTFVLLHLDIRMTIYIKNARHKDGRFLCLHLRFTVS